MSEPTKQPEKKVYFSIPMGWADMKPEDRRAYAKSVAARIMALAPSGLASTEKG